MRQISANGFEFDCEVTGSGEPVVLLHGFPESAASWRPVTELMREECSVLAPNLRGYSPGARSTDVVDYALEKLAEDVLALADAWGAPRFHLAGHDWGAGLAWYVAATRPESVATLTAVSLPHLAAFGRAITEEEDQRERSRYIGLFRTPGKAEHVLLDGTGTPHRDMYDGIEDESLRAEHAALLTEPGALTAALNWYRANHFPDFTELPAVTMPTTFVWSDQDSAIGRAAAERCGRHVDADYQFVEVPGANHWLPENEPATVAGAIVRRVRSAPLLVSRKES